MRPRLVKSKLAALVFSAACICMFGFGWSAGASPRGESGLPDELVARMTSSGSTIAFGSAPDAAAASPSNPPGRRVLLTSESSRSWTGGLSPPRSPVRDPGLITKGRLQLEAPSFRKVQASPDKGKGGIGSTVHPAIHPPGDEPIRVDGPLFDRSGRALRRSIDVGSDGSPRERSMRMHPAGKVNLHGKESRSRERAAPPHNGLSSRESEGPDPNKSGSRETSPALEKARHSPPNGFRSREARDPSRSLDSFDHHRKGSRSREIADGRVGRSHSVRTGETLWSIAAEALRTDDVRRIARYWPRIHRHNRNVVGRDPNVIFPGQILHLPLERDD